MNIKSTPIDGVKIIELKIYSDTRGFFCERFRSDVFEKNGINTLFVQDNHSRSVPRVVRGLHFQNNPTQGKLVGCVSGKIWDVAVDIRPESPTFGQHFGIELSGDNGKLLWIPGGLAHGFCVLGEQPADVLYKVDGYYNPAGDGGILWSDRDLNIPWPVQDPIISDKDAALPKFSGQFH